MTQETTFNDYYQGPQRTVIQHEVPSKGGWIIWNWRTASWDTVKEKRSAVGEDQKQ